MDLQIGGRKELKETRDSNLRIGGEVEDNSSSSSDFCVKRD